MNSTYVVYHHVDDGSGKWKSTPIGRFATTDEARWSILQQEGLLKQADREEAYSIKQEYINSQDESWSGILNQGR